MASVAGVGFPEDSTHEVIDPDNQALTVRETWDILANAQPSYAVGLSFYDSQADVSGVVHDDIGRYLIDRTSSAPPSKYPRLRQHGWRFVTPRPTPGPTAIATPTVTPRLAPRSRPTATPRPAAGKALEIEIDECSASREPFAIATHVTIRGNLRTQRAVDDVRVYGSVDESLLPEPNSFLSIVRLNVGSDTLGNMATGENRSYDVSYFHNDSFPSSGGCHVRVIYSVRCFKRKPIPARAS